MHGPECTVMDIQPYSNENVPLGEMNHITPTSPQKEMTTLREQIRRCAIPLGVLTMMAVFILIIVYGLATIVSNDDFPDTYPYPE